MTAAATTHASVATARQECRMGCRNPGWQRHYDELGRLVRLRNVQHDRGDVRRCEHGTIWFCEGRWARNGYAVSGYWTQLSPVWNFLRYRRAARVLAKANAGRVLA